MAVKSFKQLMAELDAIERKTRAHIIALQQEAAKLTKWHADSVRQIHAMAIARGEKPKGKGHLRVVA